MATQNDFTRSFGVNAAMSAFSRVVVSPNGKISLADINSRGVGIIQEDVSNDVWQNPAVRFWGTGSAQVLATAGPVTPGDTLFTATEAGYVRPSAITSSLTMGRCISGIPGAVSGVVEMAPQFNL
jgi:hypothetical protein